MNKVAVTGIIHCLNKGTFDITDPALTAYFTLMRLTKIYMLDTRKVQLAQWAAKQLNIEPPVLKAVSGDASFRRYFRFPLSDSNSIVAVDAPVEYEDNYAFHAVAKILNVHGLLVPHILHIDFKLGFILLSDLGDQLYLPHLTDSTVNELYTQAIDAIVLMQSIPKQQLEHLPNYHEKSLQQEMLLFDSWFLTQHLKIELSKSERQMLRKTFQALCENALNQPQYFVHRDFHSRNLMLTETNAPAIIDFQDAVVGAMSYDLVSLLKDCYIQWPQDKISAWCRDYYQKVKQANLIDYDFETFYRQFELMGMQRHIKILGIFCRLNYRDHKSAYLKDLPLTFDYLQQAVAKYPQFAEFNHFLQQRVMPLFNQKQRDL